MPLKILENYFIVDYFWFDKLAVKGYYQYRNIVILGAPGVWASYTLCLVGLPFTFGHSHTKPTHLQCKHTRLDVNWLLPYRNAARGHACRNQQSGAWAFQHGLVSVCSDVLLTRLTDSLYCIITGREEAKFERHIVYGRQRTAHKSSIAESWLQPGSHSIWT